MNLPSILAAALLLVLSNASTHAFPGDLDVAFGTGGKVTTPIGSGNDKGQAVAVQSDGRIVVAGQTFNGSNDDFAVVRYTSSGELDTTFGGGTGIVVTPVGSGNDVCTCVALQGNGKIVAAGYSFNGSNNDFSVVRYTSSGELDTTFGGGTGKVVTSFGGGSDFGRSVVVLSDGKILVAGATIPSSVSDFALACFNVDGSLDTSFGTGGKVTTHVTSSNNGGSSMAVQGDGKIVVAGYATTPVEVFALVRFTSSGALDTSFGTGGKVISSLLADAIGNSVALQGDGKIVVAGQAWGISSDDFAMARFDTNGSVDTSFGSGGRVLKIISSVPDIARSVAIQSNGKIILAGFAQDTFSSTSWDYALMRYRSDGVEDLSFGNSGLLTTSIGTGSVTDDARGVALQSDGKIVVAGFGRIGGSDDFAVVRYHGDPPADVDTDGLLDQWEFNNWRTTTAHGALDDSDKDGYSELLEQAFGFNPTAPNPGGFPGVTQEGGYLTITLTKQPGVTYEVQTAGTLLPAQLDSFSAASTTVLINDATTLKARDNFLISSGARRFIRLKVTAAP